MQFFSLKRKHKTLRRNLHYNILLFLFISFLLLIIWSSHHCRSIISSSWIDVIRKRGSWCWNLSRKMRPRFIIRNNISSIFYWIKVSRFDIIRLILIEIIILRWYGITLTLWFNLRSSKGLINSLEKLFCLWMSFLWGKVAFILLLHFYTGMKFKFCQGLLWV